MELILLRRNNRFCIGGSSKDVHRKSKDKGVTLVNDALPENQREPEDN